MLNEPQNTQLNMSDIRRNALQWWNKLTKSQQQTYEMKMFGYGEWWEDNSLHEDDIIKMFQRFK